MDYEKYIHTSIKNFLLIPENNGITLRLDCTKEWENLESCRDTMQVAGHWYDNVREARSFEITIDLNNPYPSLEEIMDIVKFYDYIEIHFKMGDEANEH